MEKLFFKYWHIVLPAVGGLLAFLLANAIVRHFLGATIANWIQP